jgi:hypothetical protein
MLLLKYFFLAVSQAINKASNFVSWMKSNISFYSEYQNTINDEINRQGDPFVTYSTLVFTYEWNESKAIEGK